MSRVDASLLDHHDDDEHHVVDEVVSEEFEKAAGSDPPPTKDLGGMLYSIQLLFTAVRTVFKWWNFAKDTQAKIAQAVWTVEAYVKYQVGSISDLFRTILIDPSALILNPMQSFMSIGWFFIIQVGAFLLISLLGLARLFGFEKMMQNWSKKYGGGNSVCNMDDPTMFISYDNIVQQAIKVFTSGCGCPDATTSEDGEEGVGQRVRYFNLDVAKTLLLFAAAMYERNEDDNNKAILLSIQNNPDAAKVFRRAAEQPIRKIAKHWGLRFRGISDLNSYGGSFAGIWWQDGGNWIVVSFKGTTPFDGVEWLRDLTVHKTNGKSYLFGALHEGWFSALFTNYQSNVGYSPYGSIIQTVVETAAILNAPKVHVYVTGHSLGSALAEVFYARVVKSPEDLGRNIVVRNAYLYGCPRIGDVDWAAGYYSAANTPFGNIQTLFRVVDRFDAVCRFPPGLGDDPRERDFLKPHSFLNYAHVGESVLLTGLKEAWITGNPLTAGVTIRVVQDKSSDGYVPPKDTNFNPMRILEYFIPWPLLDHFPSRYLLRLNRLVSTYDPTVVAADSNNVRKKVKSDVDKARSDAEEATRIAANIRNDVGEVRTVIGGKVAKDRGDIRNVAESIKKDGEEVRGLVADKVARDREDIRNLVDKIAREEEENRYKVERDKVEKDKEESRGAIGSIEDAARHAAFNVADRTTTSSAAHA